METFVSRRSENVLRRFQNSTSMLFFVKKAALPVNPNNVLTIDMEKMTIPPHHQLISMSLTIRGMGLQMHLGS